LARGPGTCGGGASNRGGRWPRSCRAPSSGRCSRSARTWCPTGPRWGRSSRRASGRGGSARSARRCSCTTRGPPAVHVVLLDVGKDQDDPVGAERPLHVAVDVPVAPHGIAHLHGGRQRPVGVVVVVAGQPQLLEVVLALHACGGLADLLDSGEQE